MTTKDTNALYSLHGMFIAYSTHAATSPVTVRLQLNLNHVPCDTEDLLDSRLGDVVVELT